MATPNAASEEQLAWGRALAAKLQTFPATAHILLNDGFAVDPTDLMAFLGNPDYKPVADLMTKLLLQVDNCLVGLYDESRQRQTDSEEIKSLRGQLGTKTELADRLAFQITESRPTSSTRRISKDPKEFSGDHKNIAVRQEQYMNWKAQILLNFAQDSEIFNSEKRKLLHICGHLSGDAYSNNRDSFETISSKPDDPSGWEWQTASSLLKTLDAQYQTLNLALDASKKFDLLFMMGKPYANFVAELTTLGRKCKKTPEQMVEALKKKVSDEIAKSIAKMEEPPALNDFDAWVKKCQRFWDNEQEYQHNLEQKGSNRPRQNQNQNHPFQPPAITPAPAVDPSGDPMQLDQLLRMKDEERRHCYENNLCYYCKQPGHLADNCEKKKKADERRASSFLPHSRGNAHRGRGGRGGLSGFGRGFTDFNTITHAPTAFGRGFSANSSYTPQLSQNSYNRLRALQTGFIEGEVPSSASPTPSESISQAGNQGKE